MGSEDDVVIETIKRTNEIAAELAVASSQLAKVIAAAQHDDRRKRVKDMVSVGGMIILVLVVISLLVGRQNDANAAEERSAINRDRQSCVSTITTAFQTKLGAEQLATGNVTVRLGELLLIAGSGGTPSSDAYKQGLQAYGDSIAALKVSQESLAQANELIQEIPEKCYGAKPDPNPPTTK